jgi:hypothetical protein
MTYSLMLMQGFSVILHYNLAPPQAALTPKSISCELFALFQQALNIRRNLVSEVLFFSDDLLNDE